VELGLKLLDYTGYNFTTNPFPSVGIPDDSPSVYTNRVEELRMIAETLKGTLRGGSSHVVIVGNYGNGKTSTLKYIKNQVDKQLDNTLTIYLSYPGEGFLELYNNMIYEIGLSRLEEIVWEYLEVSNSDTDLRNKVESGSALLPEIIEQGKNRLYNSLNYNDFATAFLNLILVESKFVSWKFLCGEPILHEQRKEIDVVSLIDTDEKALRAFMSLKQVLSEIGVDFICLLLDEIESIETLHIFKKQKLLNSIRRLMDLNPRGLSLIMACTPEAWSSIISDYHAFSERIFRNVVLKPVNNEIIRQLVIDYMNLARINDHYPEIYPFDEDALIDILLAAQGNVRRVLMICNRVIEKGAEKSYPTITSESLRLLLPDIFNLEE
jgi:Cdc6-like AAA superfamily ATPase